MILADEPVASASLHQVQFAATHADRIIALRSGRMIENAPAARLDGRTLEQIYARASAP